MATSTWAAIMSRHRTGTQGTFGEGVILCWSQVTRGEENSESAQEFPVIRRARKKEHFPGYLGPLLEYASLNSEKEKIKCSLSRNAKKGVPDYESARSQDKQGQGLQPA